ncbi:uncharacterized protein LOC110625723 [Manihot esculenta]|uniref:uncharacterized protein LOC110625723 n=1 Tax=Manihot esculenta TaxID=3983 RepID=UPI000B5D5D21|nr:uncharacterized protein LOC110625723 [Manihot esculenta]
MAKHRLDGGLGFKSIHEFNLAILGKQGWNIITRPHSLVACVLKARYFSTMSVSIWSHSWLKEAPDSLVSTPPPPNCTLYVVADLMIGHRWNKSLIAQLFNDRDRSCILNIPLSLSSHLDVWCWKFASKGHYSVKSAYRFLSRRVPVDSMCPLCHEAPKTVLHILVQCPFARSCWLSSPLGWPAFSAASLREWFSLAFLTASAENASLILMICWALWHNRNNVVWKVQDRTTSGVFFMALNFLQQWRGPVLILPAAPIFSLGFGCVVRDANGRFMAAKAGFFCSQMEVKCAEAMAFREALSWIKECRWDQVLFESDAQVLVVSINSVSLDDL